MPVPPPRRDFTLWGTVVRVILSYCLYLCLVCMQLVSPVAAATAALPPTNLDLVVLTVENSVDRAFLALPADDDQLDWSQPVYLKSAARHEANWLVEHIIADRLHQGGRTVATDSSAAVHLSYRVLDLGIISQAGLRGKEVHCRSRVTLSLRLSRAADSTLLWNWEESLTSEDRVPKKDIDLLQHGSYKFAQSDVEEQSWGKYIEPVVLTSVLGGLVFLFFSNR